jgi:hypothetical protein
MTDTASTGSAQRVSESVRTANRPVTAMSMGDRKEREDSQRSVFLIGLSDVRPWKMMSRAIDVHHDQLGGAYGTHDDGNPVPDVD